MDASTGRLVWFIQTAHHDLWDYDVASQPVLFTMEKAGAKVPAVAVGSKTGHLFLFDRRDGHLSSALKNALFLQAMLLGKPHPKHNLFLYCPNPGFCKVSALTKRGGYGGGQEL